jgi:hypothetical protein
MWLWLREERPWWVGLAGALVVVLYGIIPTFQPPGLDFGKVYAAYGAPIATAASLSLLWFRPQNRVLFQLGNVLRRSRIYSNPNKQARSPRTLIARPGCSLADIPTR